MKNICFRVFAAFVVTVAVLVIMGANAPLATSVTGSAASGVVSTTTGSVQTKPTGSIASNVTSSMTTTSPSGFFNKKASTQESLSAYAEELAKLIKFDRKVLIIVKETTHERIRRLVGYDEEGYQIVASGIAVPVSQDKTDRYLATLRKKLLPLQYTPFIVERNPGLKTDKIGVMKGIDQYEIIRIMHTDGEENDLDPQDVIDRLKEWGKVCSFDIIGADNDWVELEFKTLPKDLKAFVQEVNEFSPAAIERGPGTAEKLIKDIKKTNRLHLLWE
jgi:hypothetical protein